jgi:hypothetical protein
MTAECGPIDNFSINGHNMNGGRKDGYRVCSVCGEHENSRDLPRYCGPAGERVAELEAVLVAAKAVGGHKANCGIVMGFNNPCTCWYEPLQTAIQAAEK